MNWTSTVHGAHIQNRGRVSTHKYSTWTYTGRGKIEPHIGIIYLSYVIKLILYEKI